MAVAQRCMGHGRDRGAPEEVHEDRLTPLEYRVIAPQVPLEDQGRLRPELGLW
eukprot:XP_001707730.1 Brix domain containing protein [Giardia lamblia ATCC 50803]